MEKEALNQEILERAKTFFRNYVVQSHLGDALTRASKLKNYNIHPFLYKYIANFLDGKADSKSIAKALIYPRILGTSITTIFGMRSQQMIPTLFEGMMGSIVSGIDIEFIDQLDNRKKYCQIKAGPNTINKEDITTIINHFKAAKLLARTNSLSINIDDLIVGVLYGTNDDLSNHYKQIEKEYPVIIGKDFWHRLTGQENFYEELIDAIGEVALEVDGREKLEAAIDELAKEVESTL